MRINHDVRALNGTGLVALAIAICGLSAPAYGQNSAGGTAPSSKENPASSDGDIIVTALKGGVSAQRVPVTVNIVSGETIASKGLTSVEQLTSAVPGIRINQAPGGLINPVVRGLGSSPSNNSFEQTIGLFVDGVFAGHPRDYSAALFDLERVELLKGTQSAVVGKNTSVGALTLVTAKPTFELGASGSYYHEFELNTDTVNAAINIPLSDKIAVRVAGLYSDEGGWVENVLTGGDEPAVKRKAIRGTIRFKPDDRLDWTISAQFTSNDQRGQYFHTGLDALGTAAAGAAAGGDISYVLRRYETRTTPRPGFNYKGLTDVGSHNTGSRFNSTLSYDLDAFTLTSVTGYSQYKDSYLIDTASQIKSPVIRIGIESDKSFSQELRLASDTSRALNFIVGAYYYHDDWKYEDLFDFNSAQLFAPSLGGSFQSSYRQKTETGSVFGQLTYKISDSFQVSGGLRYEHFKKRGDYSPRVVVRPGGLTAAVYGPYAAFSRNDAKDYVDYSLQAQYFLNSLINAYASFATGTKGFGYVATPTSPGGVVTDPAYKTEQSETFEAGIKAGFGNGSHVNLAFFNTDLKDYQIGVNLGTNFLVRNDQIRSRGVEALLDLALLQGLKLNVAVTYADVEKKGTLPANSISSLPYAPKWSGLGSLSYVGPDMGDFRLKSDLTLDFRSKQELSDLANFRIASAPGRVRTDLRVALEHVKTGIEVAFIGRNLFDVYALSYAFNQFGSSGAVQIAEEMPRTLAVQLSFKY